MLPTPPSSTLFPYTTLFRSHERVLRRGGASSGAGDEVAGDDRERVAVEPARARRGRRPDARGHPRARSEEHTSELQSRGQLVCRLLLEKKKARHVHMTTGQL